MPPRKKEAAAAAAAAPPPGDGRRPARNVTRVDYATLDGIADHVFAAEVAGERGREAKKT